MKSKMANIVQIFLDVERPSGIILLRSWVEERIHLFNKFTLRSLLNQTFKDFHIFLICGRRHRDLTEKFPFHKKITRIYPQGSDPIGATFLSSPLLKNVKATLTIPEFAQFDTDYISITRLDSDDMFHKDLMMEVAHVGEDVADPKCRVRLLFRKYIHWDRINQYISFQNWISPPFFTHIFPKHIYQDWNKMREQHFVNHRFLCDPVANSIEMSRYKVCAIYHTANISRIKRGHSLIHYTNAQKRKFARMKFKATENPEEIFETLSPFGVLENEI